MQTNSKNQPVILVTESEKFAYEQLQKVNQMFNAIFQPKEETFIGGHNHD